MERFTRGIAVALLGMLYLGHAAAATTYAFSGTITAASSGCTVCDPVPRGSSLYSIAVGDSFSGTMTWDYNPATADMTFFPNFIDQVDFTYSFDLNGITLYQDTTSTMFLRAGQFYAQDEVPLLTVDPGLYVGQQDAFRVFFNKAGYQATDGLPLDLAPAGFDSISFALSPLGDYSWDIQGDLTGITVVPLPAAAWLFAAGLLGLLQHGRRRG